MPGSFLACPGCGALVPDLAGPTHAYLGASPGCWKAWEEVQARSFASPAVAAVQPLAVDVYAVQHPGLAERRAIQSVWVHPVSLRLILEGGRSPAEGTRAKQLLLAGTRSFARLEPPAPPYSITVLDIVAVTDFEAVPDAVRRWARVTLEAWQPHHDAIRARAAALSLGRGGTRTAYSHHAPRWGRIRATPERQPGPRPRRGDSSRCQASRTPSP